MEILVIAVRSFLMVIGTLFLALYVVGNLWKKIPAEPLKLKTLDFVSMGVVGSLFAFGLNSYWGLLSIVPILIVKLLSQLLINKNRVRGTGRWMEVHWLKMTPKGFQMPREAMSQIQKLPGDQHILIPRVATMWALTYFTKAMRKNTAKMPQQFRGQEGQAMEMIERIAVNVKRLDAGKTEKVDLPFGVLKITRL